MGEEDGRGENEDKERERGRRERENVREWKNIQNEELVEGWDVNWKTRGMWEGRKGYDMDTGGEWEGRGGI